MLLFMGTCRWQLWGAAVARGDSHSSHWGSVLKQVNETPGWGVVLQHWKKAVASHGASPSLLARLGKVGGDGLPRKPVPSPPPPPISPYPFPAALEAILFHVGLWFFLFVFAHLHPAYLHLPLAGSPSLPMISIYSWCFTGSQVRSSKISNPFGDHTAPC
jgi:hypothetical protein